MNHSDIFVGMRVRVRDDADDIPDFKGFIGTVLTVTDPDEDEEDEGVDAEHQMLIWVCFDTDINGTQPGEGVQFMPHELENGRPKPATLSGAWT